MVTIIQEYRQQPQAALKRMENWSETAANPSGLLTIAAVLSIVMGGIIDAGVIMGVAVINAILGYTTESQSERIIHSLKNLVNPCAWTIREQKLTKINSP